MNEPGKGCVSLNPGVYGVPSGGSDPGIGEGGKAITDFIIDSITTHYRSPDAEEANSDEEAPKGGRIIITRAVLHKRDTPEYNGTLTAFPERTISSVSFWVQLGERHDNNKASLITDPVHRYIHALISRTIAGRSDNCGVVIVTDRLFLYSIIERVPIHLRYVLADYLAHQRQSTRLTDIHAGPYSTSLIIGMGLEADLEGEQHQKLVSPLDMTLLTQIGLVWRAGGRYTLVGHLSGSSDEEGSDSDDSDAAEPAAQLRSTSSGPSTSRSRYTRLEEQIIEIRAV
ncbi:hypothetical protein J5N97_028250 [Dioscorea zingiberensis]|uniref:Uncharacterized protein n=1 Tax=Dioscorea zingiberensis TaxID=325984 RepID=A0A9D5BYN6_9LILI|nr:hypothetical protein J5N97_028250 [Dioscorea zingiberensis]